jgi:hypothetical protein
MNCIPKGINQLVVANRRQSQTFGHHGSKNRRASLSFALPGNNTIMNPVIAAPASFEHPLNFESQLTTLTYIQTSRLQNQMGIACFIERGNTLMHP